MQVGVEKSSPPPPPSHLPPPPPLSTSPLTKQSLGTRRPFQLVSNQQQQQSRSPSSPANAKCQTSSLQHDSSDFERGSFDYEPRSSSEMERHSSEEELCELSSGDAAAAALLNGRERVLSSGGSSDEEVRDLLAASHPVTFTSSPPLFIQRIVQARTSPLQPATATAAATAAATVAATPSSTSSSSSQVYHVTSVCGTGAAAASPRKRHRQPSTSDDSEATVIQRPCLDFYKMQGSGQPTEVSTLLY